MHVLALVLQAAETGSQQAKNPILPEANEIIWGSLAFIVLLIGMWKFAFPAVTTMMNDRTERIRRNLDDAERVKGEAQSILEEYQRQLADAKSEANRIIEEARQTAESLRRDLMARALPRSIDDRMQGSIPPGSQDHRERSWTASCQIRSDSCRL